MGKMKETAPKGKGNTSKAMARTEDPNERAEREAAIMALSQMGDAGYEKIADQAEGEIHELEVVEKEVLENVPFIIIDCKENTSTDNVNPADHPTDPGGYAKYLFVTCYCSDGKIRAFTDGGVGIRGQLGALIGKIDPRDPTSFVKCPGGLKPSKPYANSVNGSMTVTWRLVQHEKKSKSIAAAPAVNSRGARA